MTTLLKVVDFAAHVNSNCEHPEPVRSTYHRGFYGERWQQGSRILVESRMQVPLVSQF